MNVNGGRTRAALPQPLIMLGSERIFPAQPGEAGEVSVGRAKNQAVLEGERSKMRIRHQIRVHARGREQLTQNFGMA